LGRVVESLEHAATPVAGVKENNNALDPTTHGSAHVTAHSGFKLSGAGELEPLRESLIGGIKNRLLQLLARMAPLRLRPTFHRWRGVRIGSNVYIGYDSIIETSYPWLVSIGTNSGIGIRSTIIGHFTGMEKATLRRGERSVQIGDKVWIGPGVLILPNVRIGNGAVVAAGSTVTTSIAAGIFAQGNPAKPIAKCGIPLVIGTSYEEFIRHLEPWDARDLADERHVVDEPSGTASVGAAWSSAAVPTVSHAAAGAR